MASQVAKGSWFRGLGLVWVSLRKLFLPELTSSKLQGAGSQRCLF